MSISVLMFNTISSSQENIDFLEKNVPEILISNLKKDNDDQKIIYNLAWDISNSYNDWKAKSEISAYEYGKILKSDFVIYGDVIQKENGFQIIVNLYDIKKQNKFASIKSESSENDIYSIMENMSKDLKNYLKKEIENIIKNKITFNKLFSFDISLGYPLVLPEYYNIQIGVFDIGYGLNLGYKWKVSNNIFIGFRGSFKNSFNFAINNPKKVKGYFYELVFSFPIEFILNIKRVFSFVAGTGFSNFLNIYQQIDYYNNSHHFYTYAPSLLLSLGFELSPFKDKRYKIGFKNQFDFIFYSDVVNTIKTKSQIKFNVYFLYSLEE